jgi:hypothetical protein
MTDRKETPSSFAPLKSGCPIDHPDGPEYQQYAGQIRFPMPFWEWLELRTLREAGKSVTGARLQRMMDNELFCRNPIKTRVHRSSARPRKS